MSELGGTETRGEALRSSVSGGSPLRSYQDLVVGSRSIRDLIEYEAIGMWGGRVPGAAGLAFRKAFWPRLFASSGSGNVWGEGVILRQPGKMVFADRVVVDDFACLDAKGCEEGEFRIGSGVMISRHCVLSAKEGGIRLGERSTLGVGSVLYSFGGIEIGADTMIAAHCFIGGGTYDHRGDPAVPMHEQPLPGKGVIIGADCWIGAGVTILDGTRIADGAVVAAGAVVNDQVDAGSIVGGVPARQISRREVNTP